MDKYAGSYEKYMKQYAGDYQKYQNYQQYTDCGQTGAKKIASAKDANNTQELQEWKLGALEKVKCFVPDDYSSYATQTVERQYKNRLAELNTAGATTLDTKSSSSPFVAEDAVDLIEQPQMVQKSQAAAKTFLAKSDAKTKDDNEDEDEDEDEDEHEDVAEDEDEAQPEEHESDIAQSQAEATLALFADQVKSDPMTVVGAPVLGATLACLVFFAVRHRRNVQLPVAQLG
jgi:hypothetical protein